MRAARGTEKDSAPHKLVIYLNRNIVRKQQHVDAIVSGAQSSRLSHSERGVAMNRTAQSICFAIESCIDSVVTPHPLPSTTDEMPTQKRVDWYVSTYSDIRAFFLGITKRKAWSLANVRLGFLLVYGWMPTTVQSFDADKAVELAKLLNDGSDRKTLSLLAGQIANNSMVAGSKFLHFYNPPQFPITDSILQRLSGTPTRNHGTHACYELYCKALDLVSKDHRRRARKWALAAFGYRVTATRAIESLVFYSLKDRKKEKSAARKNAANPPRRATAA